ncbi:MAG: hypothetical protein R3D55_02160 [Chloroflexota bacterium]
MLSALALAVMGWARAYWPPGTVLLWLLVLMLFAFNLTRLMSALARCPQTPANHHGSDLAAGCCGHAAHVFPPRPPDFRFWLAGRYGLVAINEPGNNLWLRDVFLFGLLIFV